MRYPEHFDHIQILKDQPYFLPCVVSACITLGAIVVGYFLIEEVSSLFRRSHVMVLRNAQTLPSKIKKQDTLAAGLPRSYGAWPRVIEVPELVEPAPSMMELFKDPVVSSVLRCYFLLAIIDSAVNVLCK